MICGKTKSWLRTILMLGIAVGAGFGTVGCQTHIAGQTLPSPGFLRDDVHYYPSGPEFILHNKVRANEEYRLQQEANREGFIGGF